MFAFDKITNKYVSIHNAKKGVRYNSGCCNGDLIFCKGNVNVPHFRHYDENSNCDGNIGSTGESRLHKEAKDIITTILNENKELKFYKQCNMCFEEDLVTYAVNNGNIIQEYSFDFNGSKKIADIACVDGSNINFIIEIKNTHATKEEDRCGKWCEFSAEKIVMTNFIPEILTCLRYYICYNCKLKIEEEEEEELQFKQRQIDIKKRYEEKQLIKQAKLEYENIKKQQQEEEQKIIMKEQQRIRDEEFWKNELIRKNKKEEDDLKQKIRIDEYDKKIKELNDKREQLQKDIIELWGEENAYMIGYIEPRDIIYEKELRQRTL